MKLLLIAFAVLGLLMPAQDRIVTTTAEGRVVTVKWQAPADHSGSEWIALYPVGAPVEPFPNATLWRFVPAGTSGDLVFTVPENGEWEARYLSPSNVVLAASPTLTIGTPDDPAPVIGPPRLRQIKLFRNGVLFDTKETLDDTEAARHLTNFAVGAGRGEFTVEVRFASVSYPAQPDEVGSWRK